MFAGRHPVAGVLSYLFLLAPKNLGQDHSRAGGSAYVDHHANMEVAMSTLIRFAPPSLTAEQYDNAVRRLYEERVLPADGLEFEICFGSGDKHRVSQVWDSPEQMAAFGERLARILAELGIDPGEPEVVEVHNIIRR